MPAHRRRCAERGAAVVDFVLVLVVLVPLFLGDPAGRAGAARAQHPGRGGLRGRAVRRHRSTAARPTASRGPASRSRARSAAGSPRTSTADERPGRRRAGRRGDRAGRRAGAGARRPGRRARGDRPRGRGAAGEAAATEATAAPLVELTWLGILLLVPLVWIVLSVFEVQRGAFARHRARRGRPVAPTRWRPTTRRGSGDAAGGGAPWRSPTRAWAAPDWTARRRPARRTPATATAAAR